MAEDTVTRILTLFESLERSQKKDLAQLLNIIYGPGPHYETLLRRIRGLVGMVCADEIATREDWKSVCQSIYEWISQELDRPIPALELREL